MIPEKLMVPVCLGLVGALGLTQLACSEGEASARSFEAPRVISPASAHGTPPDDTAARFGLAPSSRAPAAAPAELFDYELPAGWSVAPATSLRAVNFLVAADARAECYLTTLPGEAGGLAANVNRWRSQMGLAPQSSAAVAALPVRDVLGGRAVAVDLLGGFTGMDGQRREGEQRLLGLIHVHPAGSLFFKAVGPREVMDAEFDAFFSLAESLRPSAAAASLMKVGGVMQVDGPGASPHGSGHAETRDEAGPARPGVPDPAQAVNTSSAPLSWTLPDGWQAVPGSSMALASFAPSRDLSARCTLTLLPGAAGGRRANFDRWAGQLGQPALDDAQLDELPVLPMLGTGAPFLALDGSFAGMGAEPIEDATLLGTAVPFRGQTLFVKFVGPSSLVRTQRGAFAELCTSLRATPGG